MVGGGWWWWGWWCGGGGGVWHRPRDHVHILIRVHVDLLVVLLVSRGSPDESVRVGDMELDGVGGDLGYLDQIASAGVPTASPCLAPPSRLTLSSVKPFDIDTQ